MERHPSAVREVLTVVENAAARVAVICACGQMHGTVLIDADGQLTRATAPLRNDKRGARQVADLAARGISLQTLNVTANRPATDQPALKLAWTVEHDSEALIGSGVIRPGMSSDMTGTSTIITLMHEEAVIDPEISSVLSTNGNWGAMTLLDAASDALRRAFHDNRRSYADVAKAAA